ncbi:uncharacterized protein LOC135808810 [Sycon ciliatum]|uniref:uncharacterized protein LOC135808810 n=1 Tax=Sycon ciliatum TaxID=27933 RepID=UPI0020AB0724|eukprot:scpid103510/ scgid19597/ 
MTIRRYVYRGLKLHELKRSTVSNEGKTVFNAKCQEIGNQIFGTRSAPLAFKDEFFINTFSRPPWPKNLDEEWRARRNNIDHIAKKMVSQGIMRDEHADFNEFINNARIARGKVRLTCWDIFVRRKKHRTPEWLAANPEIAALYPKD